MTRLGSTLEWTFIIVRVLLTITVAIIGFLAVIIVFPLLILLLLGFLFTI